LAQRVSVGDFAQRRVDPVHPVVGCQPAVVEQQMVRRHLGSDRDALLLGPLFGFYFFKG